MKQYTICPLVVGINETDQGVMTYLQGYGKRIHLPIYVFLIKGADRTILVDTGLEDFMVPDKIRETYGFDVLMFEEALARHGLAPGDVDIILHTHLHNDHCENDYKCVNAKAVVQKKELEFLQNPHPIDHRYYPDVLDDVDVEVVEGDVTYMEGIDLIFTPGHTVGGQSVAINTSVGKAVITGFCCNDKNFPPAGPAIASGVHIDVRQAWDSIQKIRKMADVLIPLHDLAVGAKSHIP